MNQTLVFEKISSFTGINVISWMDLIPFALLAIVIIIGIYSIVKKKKKQKIVLKPQIHEDIFSEDNKLVMWQQNALQTELYRIKETGMTLERKLQQKNNELAKINEEIGEINYKLRFLRDKSYNYTKQLELVKK